MIRVLGTLGRTALAAGAAAFLALAPVLPAGAAADAVPVKLPTEADALAVAVSIESILYGSQGVETRLPGPVADAERVRVGFGLDGSVVSVSDDQRMELSGVGDFEFKIGGPATDVEALPGSENDPGLRRGSVLWQGFSSGSKSLGARMNLIPGQEQVRLPVTVALDMTVDGKPWEPDGKPVSGELRIRMTVTNNTPLPIQIVDGDVGLVQGAATLDAIRANLAAGRRPVPGEAGVPTAIGLSDAAFRTTELEAPIRVTGSIHLDGRRVQVERSTGFREPEFAAGAGPLPFAADLGGGRPNAVTVELTAQVRDLRLPHIEIGASSGAPTAASLAPPAGPTWTAGLKTDPAAFDAREMAGLIMDTMWRVARLRQYDAYLGNPDPTGPARTAYRYALTPTAPEVAVAPRAPSGSPLTTVAGAAVVVVVAFGALVVWSRS